jgi:hypothetical protein
MKPLCFVLMPFGMKTDLNKKEIDFDEVYRSFIKKAIEDAGLQPIRADEEKAGGFIHKPMYERLMFCDFAVADLSFSNANVFYELGIRHALKPYTTVSIFETGTKLPFDTAPLRTFPYNFEGGKVADVENKVRQLADSIKFNLHAQQAQEDSPIAQLIKGYQFPDLDHLATNSTDFINWATANHSIKQQLADHVDKWNELEKERSAGVTEERKKEINDLQVQVVDSIKRIGQAQDNQAADYDMLLAMLNAYKSVNAFSAITLMLRPLVDAPLKDNIFMRQQLGLAYNKIKARDDAETILKVIIDKYGPDPETNGILGSVYKGLMDDNKNDPALAQEYGKQAIDTYLAGFEADPRDYYPGINALTLMFLGEEKDPRFQKFLPLVTYANERHLNVKTKDYWVQATALELAVLDMNVARANKYAAAAITCKPQKWMKETTAANLQKIYDKATANGNIAELEWLKNIITQRLA